ncbi:hypothetical protein K3495_g14202 [Podosphaera aphanis]|nr:hypothetical protein K3495_g14202 [Podosphaera aphanis]
MTRNFVTSDPRDKIFSMLGLATLSNRGRFRPNYDMSIQETFISFTLAMIRDEKSLNVMSSAGEFDHEIHNKDLPSWCPDWTSKRDVTLMGYDNFKHYSMRRNYNPNLQNLSMTENFELELEGVLIDVVTETFDLEALADELKVSIKKGTFPSVLSRYADKFGLPNYPSLDGLNPEGVLLRTLSADHWFFGKQASNYYKDQWFPTHVFLWGFQENRPTDDLVQITLMRYEPPTKLLPSEIEKIYGPALPFDVRDRNFGFEEPISSATQTKIVKEVVDQALFISKGRRILITQNGLIALGHGKTKVGDSLCSFWGADVPFVIRRRNEVDHHSITIPCYQIIGECYINNLVYGELFQHANENLNANWPHRPVMDKTQLKKIRVR